MQALFESKFVRHAIEFFVMWGVRFEGYYCYGHIHFRLQKDYGNECLRDVPSESPGSNWDPQSPVNYGNTVNHFYTSIQKSKTLTHTFHMRNSCTLAAVHANLW